ncbi:MAG: phosphoenolpyruvate synthase [Lentimicrobiaceae bacterium]|jgi:CheY-like chemotaxis protein|nr:phosphoenolpyruvate synthase [Lentimicrobiaceae bacterium]MCP4909682.1 phosphoenolpyruvate synthase [Bacteroidota bacterium]MBT3454727.1 phosphoenolpyruvate synthase [Lentimicrobiaceae bacterium]MBT3819669.1 phosphoenolpyruvate synthase [Lentimicrobiaceae bacterium]MBT4061253.1 phosphoenolpyruvate synthase [Lentimicrobiaceae bacterium]
MFSSKAEILHQDFYFNETSFIHLMRRRIYQVLLISSVYDAFMLEEDGRIDEQIFHEYTSLNLRYPPQFLKATNEEEALQILESESIDLVISMLSAEKESTFELTDYIKNEYPDVPIVMLTPFSREVTLKLEKLELRSVDYVFSWLGNADILLAIIKLIEDSMNVDNDVDEVGVQAILLVEDNIRFYSSYLPIMYKIIFQQSKSFVNEGLNEHQRMMRMRGRPKILLATNYEDAFSIYIKYKKNLLGVISDIRYMRNGVIDKNAGFALCSHIKLDNPYTPLLLQSSDKKNNVRAKELKIGFLDKNSKTLTLDLREFIKEYFAFGDFVFKDPKLGIEVARAKDLKDLQDKIYDIPSNSLRYHIQRNHFSKWLRARALFPLAELFRSFKSDDFEDLDEIRYFIHNAISQFRISKARGVISQFNRDTFDKYFSITRLGQGSIGGKARGLAFLDTLIKRNNLYTYFDKIEIAIPKTVVIGTDIFDEFMDINKLYSIALSDTYSDQEILDRFLESKLPETALGDIYKIASSIESPLAIRSSSLLEDSQYQPFAGIYNTYMIPFRKNDPERMFSMMQSAIKAVYASAYYADSKAYMQATKNVIDEEKMAIVIQEVVGSSYGDKFYPTISGVGRSIDYYPLEPGVPEDGTVSLAFGLGKYIVDGGLSLRFCPRYPKNILQTSTPELALRETQKYFFALDVSDHELILKPNDGESLKKLNIKEAEKDKSLKPIASTYIMQDNVVRDGYNYQGKKLVTFSNILKHDTIPLAEVLDRILRLGEEEMGNPVEIEFAIDLKLKKGEKASLKLLQIRPVASKDESVNITDEELKKSDSLIVSRSALGNGVINNIHDIVYVRTQNFDASKTNEIVEYIDSLNKNFIEREENYILVGPGRWGSSDPWLGISVNWSQISAARLIVESGLEDYRIDPSQGTHFFQNLTSFRIGYFTINPFINDGIYDIDFLDKQPAVFENEFVRHVKFDKSLRIIIDGKKNLGMVLKP